MTRSDWGDWLLRSIERAEPDGVAVWYLGCNGFVLKGAEGTTVFIDPYLGTGDPPRTVRMIPVPFTPSDVREADAVLATHEHSDHVHGASQAPILENTGAELFAPDDSLAVVEEEGWTDRWNVDDAQFTEVSEGDSVTIGEFTINVEPATDYDATHPVSYVVEHDAGTFYHGGDGRVGDALAPVGNAYDIDLGVLAFGTVGRLLDKETGERTRTRWYNDENDVIEAANELQLDRLLPSHWDMWRGFRADPKVLHEHARSFEYPGSLEIVEIGSRVDL